MSAKVHKDLGHKALKAVAFALAVVWPYQASAASQAEVKAAQSLLAILGYSVGTPDGVMGPATQTAVQRFLSDRKSSAKPEINEALLREMISAISAVSASTGVADIKVKPHVSVAEIKTDVQRQSTSGDPSTWVFSSRARVNIQFKNNTGRTLVGVEHQFVIRNSFGKVLHQGRDQMDVRLAPGETGPRGLFYFWEDNPFIHDEIFDKVSTAFSSGTAKVDVKILKVVFSDGSIDSYD